MRLQQYIARNCDKFKKIKGVNIDENTMEASKDYAGSFHILEMGQHYLEYRKPEVSFTKLGNTFKDFPTSNLLRKLENKTKAPGITGNIGEMIAGIVASRTLKIPTSGIGHLIVNDGRTPDYLLKNTKDFENFLVKNNLVNLAEIKKFPKWWIMESKASSSSGTVSLTDARKQLLHFWYRMQDDHPNEIGYGIAVGTSIFDKTVRIRIFVPKKCDCLKNRFSKLRNLLKSGKMSKKELNEEIESINIPYCYLYV